MEEKLPIVILTNKHHIRQRIFGGMLHHYHRYSRPWLLCVGGPGGPHSGTFWKWKNLCLMQHFHFFIQIILNTIPPLANSFSLKNSLGFEIWIRLPFENTVELNTFIFDNLLLISVAFAWLIETPKVIGEHNPFINKMPIARKGNYEACSTNVPQTKWVK